METNDIKDIWKAEIEENIKPYSDCDLNDMVVNSTRKSIRKIYPGNIFRFIVIAIILYLLLTLFLGNKSTGLILTDIGALIILSVSYFLWERSAYKMRKYTYGIPIKEWLEYRIKEIEKSMKFNTKYNLIIYTCSFLFAIGFYILYQIIANTTPNLLNVIIIPIGLIVYLLIVKRSLNRNYKEVLHELKELYNQFEESTE